MSSTNISIKGEAYEFLKSIKTETESFSDVILKLRTKASPLDFFGKLKDLDWNAKEKNINDLRSSLRKRL